jgi:hypothetical protein
MADSCHLSAVYTARRFWSNSAVISIRWGLLSSIPWIEDLQAPFKRPTCSSTSNVFCWMAFLYEWRARNCQRRAVKVAMLLSVGITDSRSGTCVPRFKLCLERRKWSSASLLPQRILRNASEHSVRTGIWRLSTVANLSVTSSNSPLIGPGNISQWDSANEARGFTYVLRHSTSIPSPLPNAITRISTALEVASLINN